LVSGGTCAAPGDSVRSVHRTVFDGDARVEAGIDDEYAIGADMRRRCTCHLDSCICDIDATVRTDRDGIEHFRMERPDIDCRQRLSGVAVDRARDIDVRGPDRIAVKRESLRCVE